jgi:molybdopterin synthase sulfur carrier subunit
MSAADKKTDPADEANLPLVAVWVPSLLQDLTNGKEKVHVRGATVRQIIEALDRLYPGMKARLCTASGLRPGIAVAVNSQVATLGVLQPVQANSEIHFLPAISGG